MPSINDQLADLLTDHQVDLLRIATDSQRKIAALLTELEHDIINQLNRSDLTDVGVRRLNNLLVNVRERIAESFAAIADAHGETMLDLVRTEAGSVASMLNSTFGVDLVAGTLPIAAARSLVTNMLVMGAPSAEWWSRQAGDLAFRFASQVRLGMLAGETNQQIVARIIGTRDTPGLLDLSQRNARALVQTSVQTGANAARFDTYKRNADIIKAVQQLSTLDNHTTDICIAYDKQTWDLDGNPIGKTKLPFNGGPPRHWNCRSVLVPVTKSWRELGVDVREDMPEGTRASMDGQVAADTSFEQWFSRKSAVQQDEILGAGKAELFRQGKISMTDLLDQRGRPLTLEELQRKRNVRVRRTN